MVRAVRQAGTTHHVNARDGRGMVPAGVVARQREVGARAMTQAELGSASASGSDASKEELQITHEWARRRLELYDRMERAIRDEISYALRSAADIRSDVEKDADAYLRRLQADRALLLEEIAELQMRRQHEEDEFIFRQTQHETELAARVRVLDDELCRKKALLEADYLRRVQELDSELANRAAIMRAKYTRGPDSGEVGASIGSEQRSKEDAVVAPEDGRRRLDPTVIAVVRALVEARDTLPQFAQVQTALADAEVPSSTATPILVATMAGLPARLRLARKSSGEVGVGELVTRLARRLQAEHGLAPTGAWIAVGTWACAFGIATPEHSVFFTADAASHDEAVPTVTAQQNQLPNELSEVQTRGQHEEEEFIRRRTEQEAEHAIRLRIQDEELHRKALALQAEYDARRAHLDAELAKRRTVALAELGRLRAEATTSVEMMITRAQTRKVELEEEARILEERVGHIQGMIDKFLNSQIHSLRGGPRGLASLDGVMLSRPEKHR